MPYKQKTEFFGIPFISNDETVSEAEEKKAANIIENQLLAATKGVRCAVFEDGHYRLVDNVDGTYTVMLVGTGERIAFEGIVNGGYCYSKNPVLWEKLIKGKTYHLYVKFTSDLYADEHAFKPITKENFPYGDNVFNVLYLAKIDLSVDKPAVDAHPNGKVYGTDIAHHANDKTNPHGRDLVQDNLDVQKSFKFQGAELYNGKDGILDKVEKLSTFSTEDGLPFITSGGTTGVNVGVTGKIVSVDVVEAIWEGQPPSFELGEIAIKIEGQNATIYNSGKAGIPLHVSVWYR